MRHGAVAEEDTQRAQYYRLLSRLLAAPPDEGAIALVAELEGSDTPLGGAVSALGKAARETTADAAGRKKGSRIQAGSTRGRKKGACGQARGRKKGTSHQAGSTRGRKKGACSAQ